MKRIFVVAFATLIASASGFVGAQDLVQLLRNGSFSIIDAKGKPAKVEIVGDKLVVELPPAAPPRMEIPIRQIKCNGSEFSEMFFMQCYSGECMVAAKDRSQFKMNIQMFTMADKKDSAAAMEACTKLQNSLGGAITK